LNDEANYLTSLRVLLEECFGWTEWA